MTPALAAYLQALTTRCEQATKGPWVARREDISNPYAGQPGWEMFWIENEQGSLAEVRRGCEEVSGDMAATADLMSHARTDLPTLVRLVRDAHAALETTRDLWKIALETIEEYERGTVMIPFHVVHKPIEAINEALAHAETMVKEGG